MAEFKKEKQKVNAEEILKALAAGDEIDLSRCTISGSIDMNSFFDGSLQYDTENLIVQQFDNKNVITFTQKISFNNCKIEDDIIFASPWAQPDTLQLVFKGDVSFNSSVFRGQTRFSKAHFQASASFDGCQFHSVVCFRQATFSSFAMFRTVQFNGYALFNNTNFENKSRLSSTFFAKGVNFTNTQFLDDTDFAGVYAGSKTVPIYDGIKFSQKHTGNDQSFWRFIKQCALEAGHYQLAGESFYKERCAFLWFKLRGANYDSLNFFKKTWRQIYGLRLLPEFIFGRMLFGYGERPIRVLVSSAIVILVCAMLYFGYHENILIQNQPMGDESFVDCLYFSVSTFATLGLGDVYPVKDSFLRIVVMIEVLSGACLMSLFVVSLAKRFSRS